MADEGPKKPRGTPKRELARRAVDADAHARAPAKAERVRFIAQLMSDGDWWGGPSHYALSEKWGLSVDTIRSDASEAGRLMKPDPKELDAIRFASTQRILRRAHQAATERNIQTGLADVSASLKAEELAAKFQGLLDAAPASAPPTRIEVVVLKPDDKIPEPEGS